MSDNNSQALDPNLTEFVEALVVAITGFHIKEIPSEKREEIVKDCVEFFTGYIVSWVEENHNKKDAIRLKVGYETGENVFKKYPELEEKYDEAYAAFVKMLEENLKEDEQKAKEDETGSQDKLEALKNR